MDVRDGNVQVSKMVNRFEGMSTLRSKEREAQPKSDQAKALEKYLQKYTDSKPSGKEGKSKKRKRPPAAAQGLTIVDMDASGFVNKPEKLARKKVDLSKYMLQGGDENDDDDDDKDDDDGPVVANVGEAEHLAKLVAKEKSGAALQNWQAIKETQPSTVIIAASPPRRKRHDTPDESPPRRFTSQPSRSPPRRQRHDSPDASPPRKQRHDSSDDSPPRKPGSKLADDASPPRRSRHDSPDASPPRRVRAEPSDASPPRRRKAASPDASPPRRQRAGQTLANESGGSASKGGRKDGAVIMSDGTAAGMVSGKQLVAEMDLKRAEERKRFAKLEAASGSRGAQTVYRNKETGARMSKEEFEAANKKASEKKKAVREAPEWGGGMRQIREREQRAQDLLAERAKPFARTKDDVDEELNLRGQVRFGDPMSHLVKQRGAAPPPPIIPAAMAKQMKKSGFVVPQEVPAHSWMKRNLGPPPNRYGIRPGRHWDGVDRSTGFERDLFKMQATRAAREKEAKAWAQADM